MESGVREKDSSCDIFDMTKVEEKRYQFVILFNCDAKMAKLASKFNFDFENLNQVATMAFKALGACKANDPKAEFTLGRAEFFEPCA